MEEVSELLSKDVLSCDIVTSELITRLRVVPHFPSGMVPDSRASEMRAPMKIISCEKNKMRQGERKMRDYRQSPSF